MTVDGESSVMESNDGHCEISLDGSMPQDNTNATTDTPITSRRGKEARQLMFETPTRETRTPSKFVFLSDRKSVPTEMKNLQERTIKRRRDFLAQIHEMDCLTAKLMSQYAEERMNLDLATSDTFERTVIHPLVTSVERLALVRESSRILYIPSLERRIDAVDTQMTRHINVSMSDAKIDSLDSLQNDIQRNLKSELRTENNTFNKIEGGIVQRYESVVGTNTSNFYQEGASCRSAITLLEHKIENTVPKRFERPEKILAEIASIRQKLREERAKRIAKDKEIMEDIVRSTSALKRSIIAMASDGDISR